MTSRQNRQPAARQTLLRSDDQRLAERLSRRVHGGLLLVMIVMICFGLVMLFSASMLYSLRNGPMYYILRQSAISAVGLVAALLIALVIPITFFDQMWIAGLLYVISLGMLVYTQMKGTIGGGAVRWITLFGQTFQPSELVKMTVVLFMASYVSWTRRLRRAGRFRARTPMRRFLLDGWVDILIPLLLFSPMLVLIVIQPHVSALLILLFTIAVCLIAAGFRWRSWLSALPQGLLLLLVLVLVIALIIPLLPENIREGKIFRHVNNRLEMFNKPEVVSEDEIYQIRQAQLAIGAGGLTGRGLGQSRQKYGYLPEAHNDYILATIGEELGLMGTLSVLALFLLLLIFGLGIARRAANGFCAIIAAGYTMLLMIQALLHIAVNTNSIPATGVSLPLFSYGGTSNLFFLIEFGLLLAVSRTGQRLTGRLAPEVAATGMPEVGQGQPEWQPVQAFHNARLNPSAARRLNAPRP